MSDGSVTVHYDEAPGTINKGGGGTRGHWSKGHKEKMRWEGIYMALILQARLPKHLDYVSVHITLEYVRPNTKRDPENFRQPVVKPLADALVKAGYLPDDTREHFEVEDLVISKTKLENVPPLVRSRITLRIDYRLARTAPEPSVLAAPATGGTGSAGAHRSRSVGDDAHARRAPASDRSARGN